MSIVKVPQFLLLYNYARDIIGDDFSSGLVMTLIEVTLVRFMKAVNNFQGCQRFDYLLHDIPPEKEAEVAVPPKQNTP